MAQLKQVCTVTNGSQTVAVIGVNVAYRILANSIFMTSPDFVPYTVAKDAVFDGTNTVVTLTAGYQGESGAMAQGVFVTDFTYPDSIPLISQGDVGTAAIWTKAMYQLQAMIGSITPAGLNAFIAQMNEKLAAADADAAAALASQAAAKTSETNAKTSETNASASKSAAAASATNAKTSETNSKTSETNSASSASASAGSATASSNSATAAAGSATAASTSASNASGSASAAAASKTAAGTSETNAKTSETNAAGSAAAALASQTAAKTSETNAKTSETNAKTSETNAKASETNAKTSETNAAASATNAAADRATVQGILTTMNALYLGNKASAPTVDNSGNPLQLGAEYFDTTKQLLRVYTSTGWQDYDKDAQTQATNATASAAAAAGSASGAATSATNAHTSETNAATSAAAALASQNAAKTSETNAKTSESNAKSSETNALTSETNAKTSETNAAASAAHADQVAQNIGNPVSKNGDTMVGDLLLDNAKLQTTRYGTGGALIMRGAGGSQAAPSALAINSQSGTLAFRGYDGAAYQDLASVDGWSEAAVSSTSAPGHLRFYTTPSGSVAKQERVRITAAGRVLIGTTTDNGVDLLQVSGTANFGGNKVSIGRTSGEGEILLGQNDGYFFANATQTGWYSPTKGGFRYNFSDGSFTVGANNYPVWHSGNLTPFDKTAGGTISAATTIDMASSATTAHLSLKGSSGALSTESKLRFYGTFGTGSDLGTRLVASMRAGFNAGTWGKEYLDFYLNSASNDAQSDANQSRVLRLAYGGRMIVGTNAVDDGVNRLQVSGNVALSGAMKVGTYTQQVEINGDSYTAVNASYDGTNWQRIDTTKPAWLFQSNVTNNMTFESYKGLSWWVCQPGANPIGNWGAANGWTLIQSYSQYHDVTLGGNGFEIDGNGTLPYGRFQHATVGSLKRTGVMTNAYIDESGRDDTTQSSWWFGVSDDGTASGDKWKIQRAASGSTFAWTDLVTVNSAGRVLVGTTTDNGTDLLQVNGGAKVAGALSVSGTSTLSNVNLSGTMYHTGGALELGSTTATMTPFIDFHSSGSTNDYDARIIASGGTAGTLGAGSLNLNAASTNVNGALWVANTGTFSALYLKAGSYQPFIRSNSAASAIEFINSSNTAVNLTVSDSGAITARGQVNAPTVSATGGTSQFAAVAVNGTLWIQNQNQIALQGNGYTGYLRGDAGGLVGFINQAQGAWNFQIWDDGRTVTRGLATFNGAVAQSYQNFGFLNGAGAAVNNAAGTWSVSMNVSQAVQAAQFFATSDRRLKTEIVALDESEAIRFVEEVEPKVYLKEGVRERGYLAQDIGKALGGAGCELITVSERKGLLEEVDEDGFVSPADHVLNVAHNQIIPIHSATLRNLLRRVAQLEALVSGS